jgi:uncharacterized protein involved in outer membrane biogenesis
MKKFLKIFAIVILALLIIIIAIPIVFKKQIEEKVKTEINKNVNAKVDWESFHLSLIRSFPNFYMSLDGLTVVGVDTFAKDTLIAFKSFSTRLDLVSVIKMTDIKIKAIILDSPVINAIVLKNGKANWDIAKPSADTTKVKVETTAKVNTTVKVDTTKSKPSTFKVRIKKFEIINANISYNDQSSGMSASMKNFNFKLSGNFSQDFASLKILSNTDAIDFSMGGIKYLKKASNRIDISIDADLKNSVYTLKENEFALNDIVLGWNGTVAMKDTNIITNLTFNTKRTDFKSLLSLVPGVFMKGYEGLKTSGSLKLDGYVKGTYNKKTMPNVALNMSVDNAMFKYPALPKSVDNINIAIKLFWDGVQKDNSTVDVDKFHFEIAKNPVDIVLNLKTPISDPAINGKLNGKIDLASIADVVPMDSTTLAGLIEANIDLMGQMSMIQKQEYEKFKANGAINLTGFKFSNPSLKQGAVIDKAILLFSPKFVELSRFDAKVGKSDFHMKGKLTNFIAYALKGATIEGTLDFSSTLLDLNEFMQPQTEQKQTQKQTQNQPQKQQPSDTSQLSTIEVPKNIDFTLTTKIRKINFQKLEITNISGLIKVIDGKVEMNNVVMNMLQGSMNMNGEYNTQNIKKAFVDLKLGIKDFDIPASFKAFNTVQKLAPIAENAKGKYSLDFTFKSPLDAHMNPILNSLNGEGKLTSKEVEVTNSKTFDKIADALKNDKLKKVTITDINLTFHIKDGRIYIDPFDTKILGYNTNISGDQGIDQTMNYLMIMAIPRSEFGSEANQALNSLTSILAAKGLKVNVGEMVNVGITIKGTVSDPKIGIKLNPKKGTAENKKEESPAAETGKSTAADDIIANAQKEADAVKTSSKQAADIVRKESNDNAQKILNQGGSNPFTKKAAEISAKKVRQDGEDKAKKIEDDGNQKADAIMKKAQDDADKLK